MSHILVVEDEEIICKSIERLLKRNNYEVTTASNFLDAKNALNGNKFDLVISDVRLPDNKGTDLIAVAGDTPVLIMTSFASMQNAIEAMKLGAVDYIAKPFEHKYLLECVIQILGKSYTVKPLKATKSNLNIIGNCDLMQQLFSKIHKVAPTNSTVLIQGESGTGKELVAHALHNLSPRASKPIICVNCASIADSLIESELFGYEKGAFTGANTSRIGLIEAASGGTLFLDEIGELPLESQARMLRVLQEKEIRKVGATNAQKVDVRLIAATHRDLQDLIKKGKFRQDLFYRLNVINLLIPALRKRGQDIMELAKSFLTLKSTQYERGRLTFSLDAINAINEYSWPGNVRELKNIIERAVILCEGQKITTELLGLNNHKDLKDIAKTTNLSLEDYFCNFVLENQNNMTETDLARHLGISRKTLWERRQKLGIARKGNT